MFKRQKYVTPIMIFAVVVSLRYPCFAQTNPVNSDSASIEITSEGILLKSTIPVYAMQFKIVGEKLDSCVVTPTEVLTGFEVGINKSGERIKVLVYNLNRLTIPAGEHLVFTLTGGQNLNLQEIIVSDKNGRSIPTDVKEKYSQLLQGYKLYPNYPNPFNSSTTLRYQLLKPANVKLAIFDSLGRNIRVLEEKKKSPGFFQIVWDGRDKFGRVVSGGIFYARFTANKFVAAGKLIMLK